MRLSVLDQSPVTSGMSPAEALANTLDLARRMEGLGYHRYWVSEHHNDHAFAHAAPEIMVTRIASMTDTIRVGSGGVLLPHYSPYKVAEQFNLLETLFPERIDLGIGRAPGGEGRSTAALQPGRGGGATPWEKIDQLLAWMGPGDPSGRPFPDVHARPLVPRHPEYWILGTSPASARFAAERGLPYAFGGFIDPRQAVAALQTYHQRFRPSRWLERPRTQLTWFALAAETEREAWELGRCAETWFVRTFLRGHVSAFPTDAEAHDERWSPQEEALVEMRRQTTVVGTPTQVAEGLAALQRQLFVDEFGVVTITATHATRTRSYELLAAAI